jgi:hypothetical protein
VCGTCTQNKHECAGYGPENDISPTEANKDSKKAARRESNTSNNVALARKVKQEAAPRPTRPPLPHVPSNTSMNSDSSANIRLPKAEDGHGTFIQSRL